MKRAFTFLALVPFASAQTTLSTVEESFRWKSALAESGMFLGIQQGFRVGMQESTREGLKGPFFRDWARSVKSLRGWDDGDGYMANYIGHPLQGAVTANIQVVNDPRYRNAVFGRSSQYWKSRMRAMAWSAGYSTFYELSPLGDAGIGNLGYRENTRKAAVDLVITPVLGLAWQATEDALDRYVIARVDEKSKSFWVRMFVRCGLNPSRTVANTLHRDAPWRRYDREGIWKR